MKKIDKFAIYCPEKVEILYNENYRFVAAGNFHWQADFTTGLCAEGIYTFDFFVFKTEEEAEAFAKKQREYRKPFPLSDYLNVKMGTV